MKWSHNFPRHDGNGAQSALEAIVKALPDRKASYLPINEFMPVEKPLFMAIPEKNIFGVCTPSVIDRKIKDFDPNNLKYQWQRDFGWENPTHYWSF